MADIVRTDGVMGGQPRLDGHRISVVQVVEWVLEDDLTPETVAAEFDVELADVYRALTYYYDHVDELRRLRERREARIAESRDAQPAPESFSETI